jgi:hypothetical protein
MVAARIIINNRCIRFQVGAVVRRRTKMGITQMGSHSLLISKKKTSHQKKKKKTNDNSNYKEKGLLYSIVHITIHSSIPPLQDIFMYVLSLDILVVIISTFYKSCVFMCMCVCTLFTTFFLLLAMQARSYVVTPPHSIPAALYLSHSAPPPLSPSLFTSTLVYGLS